MVHTFGMEWQPHCAYFDPDCKWHALVGSGANVIVMTDSGADHLMMPVQLCNLCSLCNP